MVTFISAQPSFADAIRELLHLDNAAIEAYEKAISKLDNLEYKQKLREFMHDHQEHVDKLYDLLKTHHEPLSDLQGSEKWFTKGEVVITNLVGDQAILIAMASNEIDTNTAYKLINERKDKWEDSVSILNHWLEDEKGHLAWLKNNIDEE
jgi:rubrerythrin